MLVTVAVSVFNAAPFIEDCINGIRAQTYKDIEILFIVDSSTTDDTLDILNDPKYSDVRVIIQNDKDRLSGGRNLGMDNAKGDLIWFLDADDYFVPTLLEEMVDIMEKNDCDVSAFNYYYTSERHLKEPGGNYEVQVMEGPRACKMVSEGHIPIQTWSKIFRTSFLRERSLRFSCKQYSEDYDHTMRAFMDANAVAYYNKPLYTYYLHMKSCSVGAGDDIIRRDIEITDELMKKMKAEHPDSYGTFCSSAAKHVLRSMTNATKLCFKEVKNSDVLKRCITDGTDAPCTEVRLFNISPTAFYYVGKTARRIKFSKRNFVFKK